MILLQFHFLLVFPLFTPSYGSISFYTVILRYLAAADKGFHRVYKLGPERCSRPMLLYFALLPDGIMQALRYNPLRCSPHCILHRS